jgi:hypothetical protein
MKSFILLTMCFFVVFLSNAADPNPRKNILIVGFSNSYFNSNSFETVAAVTTPMRIAFQANKQQVVIIAR